MAGEICSSIKIWNFGLCFGRNKDHIFPKFNDLLKRLLFQIDTRMVQDPKRHIAKKILSSEGALTNGLQIKWGKKNSLRI